mgnify:CR=1 FL=1
MIQKPLHSTHISVVRNELPINMCMWNKYSNLDIEFKYDSYIYNDELYFWLNVQSILLENIRLELGLSNVSSYTMSPDGSSTFHITIANTKHLNKYL